jgi:alpha-tubulin suppressor-like RCC1 family protein
MRFAHQSTKSQRLRRLCELGTLAIIQVLAVGCGGDAAPDATACDRRSPCVRELEVGSTHACARLDNGTVRCWGANTYGQVGADHTDLESRPVAVRLVAKADKLRLGAQTSCAFASGQLSCWGRNADFGAGPGVWADDTAYPLPVSVPNPKITDIGLGRDVFCTLSSDGEVACVGNGAYGNTGLGSDVPPVPVLTPIPGLHASALSVGYSATCATLQGGGVSCWGDNADLLIGPEADTGRAIESPRTVPELADLRELRLSLDLGCGVSEQQVHCWGANQSANSGADGPGPVWPPNSVAGSEGLTQPSTNAAACALGAEGNVKCWGSNKNAQLGMGSADSDEHPSPAPVAGLSAIASVATGFDFACALTRDGHVLCWGANLWGQLGNGHRDADFHAPTEVLW